MQLIRKCDDQIRLDPGSGYLTYLGPHKHRFRLSYYPQFFQVGFVCRDCDEIVVVEREVWYEFIRLGLDRRTS